MIVISRTMIALAAVGVLLLIVLGVIIFKKRPRKLKGRYFEAKWQELQMLCQDKATWPDAILLADKLLDDALKKRRLGGKSMGERLVSAQRLFSDNDGVWYGHKLRMQLEQHPDFKLKKSNVKNALVGLRQALKDLGAL